MKMVLTFTAEIKVDFSRWVETLGFQVVDDYVVDPKSGKRYSHKMIETEIEKWFKEAVFLNDPDGFWLQEKFFGNEREQELFLERLEDLSLSAENYNVSKGGM